MTVLPLTDRDSIAASGVAGPSHSPVQNRVSAGSACVQWKGPLPPYRAIWVDEMKGGNEDLGNEAISPRFLSSMAAKLAKEVTPSGAPFSSCCGGPYVASCSGKICLFPLQLHLLLHCSFSCPVEDKAKRGDKQEMMGLDHGQGCPRLSNDIVYQLLLLLWGFLLRDVQLESIHGALSAWFCHLPFLVNSSEGNRDSSYSS